jgi:hypothetical protein
MDLHVPPAATTDRPWPLIAWIHGGAFREGSRTDLPDTLEPVGFQEHLLARGYAVADIDYRLSREAVFPARTWCPWKGLSTCSGESPTSWPWCTGPWTSSTRPSPKATKARGRPFAPR